MRGDLVDARTGFVLSERTLVKAERQEKNAMHSRDQTVATVSRILVTSASSWRSA